MLVKDGRTGFLGEGEESHPQDHFEGIYGVVGLGHLMKSPRTFNEIIGFVNIYI